MRKLAVGSEPVSPTERDRLLELHGRLCGNALDIMRKKNHDYSGGNQDPYCNFRQAEQFGIHPAVGLCLRIGDKLQRIRTFAERGKLEVDGEGLEDACVDIVNYAVLAYGLLTENTDVR